MFFNYEFFDPNRLAFRKFWVFEIDPAGWVLKRRMFAETARLDGSNADSWKTVGPGIFREPKSPVPPTRSFSSPHAFPCRKDGAFS